LFRAARTSSMELADLIPSASWPVNLLSVLS
jgi:hypothetical protein